MYTTNLALAIRSTKNRSSFFSCFKENQLQYSEEMNVRTILPIFYKRHCNRYLKQCINCLLVGEKKSFLKMVSNDHVFRRAKLEFKWGEATQTPYHYWQLYKKTTDHEEAHFSTRHEIQIIYRRVPFMVTPLLLFWIAFKTGILL